MRHFLPKRLIPTQGWTGTKKWPRFAPVPIVDGGRGNIYPFTQIRASLPSHIRY